MGLQRASDFAIAGNVRNVVKKVAEIVPAGALMVSIESPVENVIELLLARGMDGVPVVTNGTLAGMVFYRHLVNATRQQSVASVMNTRPLAIAPEDTLCDAADAMVRDNVTGLPVIGQDGAYLGLVTCRDLLAELRRPADPLTGLAMSDGLREWASSQLSAGREITVLFFDVNDFGPYNKRYGHVIGDRVLQAVADTIRRACDPAQDFAGRYGGDEFCIITLRSETEARALGRVIEDAVSQIAVPDMPAPIAVTVGQRGGRRTHERDAIHLAATVNDLINLASRDCLSRKPVQI